MKMDFNWESVNGLARALGGRVELLEKVFKEKGLTPAMIQKIVASGFASDFFDIGDEIMTTYTATDGTEYDFPWRVVDFRDVYWENDPEPHPGMVLQAVHATAEQITWSQPCVYVVSNTELTAEEGWEYWGADDDTSYTNKTYLELNVGDPIPHGERNVILKVPFENFSTAFYGANDYVYSQVRQWLNSDAEAGNWWTAPFLGAETPVELDTVNGFMHGFDQEFIDAIKPTRLLVRRTYELDYKDKFEYLFEKFYVPSCVELYGREKGFVLNGENITTSEENPFKYWVNVFKDLGYNSWSSFSCPARAVSSVSDLNTKIRTFTRTTAMRTHMFFLKNDGACNSYSYVNDYGALNVLPCCVIS